MSPPRKKGADKFHTQMKSWDHLDEKRLSKTGKKQNWMKIYKGLLEDLEEKEVSELSFEQSKATIETYFDEI